MQLSRCRRCLYLIIIKSPSQSCKKQPFVWNENENFNFYMSQCIGLFGVIWSTHNYNVKISFWVIWSTMASQLKLITCVYIVLFVRNNCKLMLTTALLTSLNVISPIRFYLNKR